MYTHTHVCVGGGLLLTCSRPNKKESIDIYLSIYLSVFVYIYVYMYIYICVCLLFT